MGWPAPRAVVSVRDGYSSYLLLAVEWARGEKKSHHGRNSQERIAGGRTDGGIG